MINILQLHWLYKNEWVVFDGLKNILDHGPDLEDLWTRHAENDGKRTFYFAAGF